MATTVLTPATKAAKRVPMDSMRKTALAVAAQVTDETGADVWHNRS